MSFFDEQDHRFFPRINDTAGIDLASVQKDEFLSEEQLVKKFFSTEHQAYYYLTKKFLGLDENNLTQPILTSAYGSDIIFKALKEKSDAILKTLFSSAELAMRHVNLSAGGVALDLGSEYDIGQSFYMRIDLHSYPCPLFVKSTLVHSQPSKNIPAAHYTAFEFNNYTADAKSILEWYVKKAITD